MAAGFTSLQTDKNTIFNHNLDKARALFTDAGMIGTSFEMLATNTNAIYKPVLEILQSDLASIGVQMTINQMDIALMLGRMNAHQFQAYLSGDNWANFEPITLLSADGEPSIIESTTLTFTTKPTPSSCHRQPWKWIRRNASNSTHKSMTCFWVRISTSFTLPTLSGPRRPATSRAASVIDATTSLLHQCLASLTDWGERAWWIGRELE